jgi:hypothetical protein
VGRSGGGASREPAGTTAVFPLLVSLGSGLPHWLQNHFPKLFADGRLYREMKFSPDSHFNWLG